MGYAEESGYTPATIDDIMLAVMNGINTQFGTTYTAETFVGTNFYKYFYAIAQRVQENEVKTSEIFLKLQQYFIQTNEKISRPVVTNPGLVDKFFTEGWIASVKKPIDVDAGKVYICVDVDDTDPDYADMKEEICTLVKDCTVAGVVSQGSEVESIVLSNGQSFDFKFNLPTRIPVLLKLTITLSENNMVVIKSPDAIKNDLVANIAARYRLGRNFEPERYYTVVDAPWAASVLLEWSDDDGATWQDEVFDSEYNELFVIDLEDIELVEV